MEIYAVVVFEVLFKQSINVCVLQWDDIVIIIIISSSSSNIIIVVHNN